MNIQYDESLDVLIIEGVRYSGAYFRELALPPQNRVFRILKNENGTVTVQSYQVEIFAFESWHERYERYRRGE